VRRVISFVAILLLLVTAAPVLACVTDSAMTHEERTCCRSMHGDCGEMVKTGCCQTQFHADLHPQVATSSPHLQLALLVVRSMESLFTPARMLGLPVSHFPDEHSPPGLLIARTTVLRI
jgi:hypothetical protein